MILEPRKIKSDTVSSVSPTISHEVMGPDAMIFVFRLKGAIICISEVVHISPGNLDSSLYLIQPGISLDVLYI